MIHVPSFFTNSGVMIYSPELFTTEFTEKKQKMLVLENQGSK
jgi:hypothetical protein